MSRIKIIINLKNTIFIYHNHVNLKINGFYQFTQAMWCWTDGNDYCTAPAWCHEVVNGVPSTKRSADDEVEIQVARSGGRERKPRLNHPCLPSWRWRFACQPLEVLPVRGDGTEKINHKINSNYPSLFPAVVKLEENVLFTFFIPTIETKKRL